MRPIVNVSLASAAVAALALAILPSTSGLLDVSASSPANAWALAGGQVWFGGFYYPSNAVTAPTVLSTSSG